MAPQKYAFRFLFLMVSLVLCLTSWGQCDITTCGNQTVAPGQAVQLWAEGATDYQWSPSSGLSATDTPNPFATPSTTTTYTLTVVNNLINNGDFESGFSGFNTSYSKSNYINDPKKYYVDSIASTHHTSSTFLTGYGHGEGHNSSSHSKFFMAKGATNSNVNVWKKTINVTPHTNYTLSAWVCSLKSYSNVNNRSKLRFQINGNKFGEEIICNQNTDYWEQFNANGSVWNSGNNTSATITIIDVNTNESGNFFGIDDIVFASNCPSMEITVLVMDHIAVPPVVCAGGSLVLTEPQVYGASGVGQWEIAPTDAGPFTTFSNGSIPATYNGYRLRYAFNYNGDWYFSNVVSIAVEDLNVSINPENTEICEGEEVILHAIVPPAVFYTPGDILCTDGTIVKPSNWPCGKTAKGIVFYVDASGQHGWAVSPTAIDHLRWGSVQFSKHDIPYLTNYSQWREAVQDFDGRSNTQIIRNYSLTIPNIANNPALSFPAPYAMDLDNGWYLPAAGQLNVLFGEILAVNASLAIVEGVAISASNDIWSSTEFQTQATTKRAYKLELSNSNGKYTGRICDASKTDYLTVRAVINF